MLKINQTFARVFFLIVISFFLFLMISYFSLKLIVISPENMELYNQVWMMLITLFISMLLFIYLSIKTTSNRLSKDVKELNEYLEEVSNKNYKAVVKISYFHEFLEMSLRLKNIIKRLNNKDMKKK